MKSSVLLKLLVTAVVAVTTLAVSQAQAQTKVVAKFRNDYYDARRAAHDLEGMQQGAIVFVGNSITEQGWWSILIKRDDIENRGIGGDNTFGMIDRLPDILKSKPAKIFLMAGINDLTAGYPMDTIVSNIRTMVKMAREASPATKFYVQSVLPVNDSRLAYASIKGKNPQVTELNERLKGVCAEHGATYVDVASQLRDKNGDLQLALTKDGIHLHPEAYVIWVKYLNKNKLLK